MLSICKINSLSYYCLQNSFNYASNCSQHKKKLFKTEINLNIPEIFNVTDSIDWTGNVVNLTYNCFFARLQ